MTIGIDLGTSNSVAAFMAPDGPRLIPNAFGDFLTPSVVGIGIDGALLVGRPAKEFQISSPDRCASIFKRRMGSPSTTKLAGREFTPEELSSLVLRSLMADVEEHLGGPVESAVITVPAYFNERQRKATIHAGRLAGIQVERIINEPTAAAIAYGYKELGEEKTLLVFDLGGGTFDVSVVEMFEGVVEVRASSGDSLLGGVDFIAAMAAQILQSQGRNFEQAEFREPKMMARLMRQCETAKQRLSTVGEAKVRVPDREGLFADDSQEVTVSREQFEDWTGHILSRLDMPLRRVLSDTRLAVEKIDEIILVGGATRMPCVTQRLSKQFHKEPMGRLNPDEVVALGAAVQAGLIDRNMAVAELVVTDIAPFTLGIEICKEFASDHRDGYFMPVLHRNTPIPTSRIERVFTLQPNQTKVKVSIYQGESRRVEQNILLTKFTVEGIPCSPTPQPVDIRFTYDLNGILEVEATIVETQRKVAHLVTQHAHAMSPKAIAKAVEEMQALKQHPRDESENRLLLLQAERLYTELPLDEQQHLANLLDGFESVLEMNDKTGIERFRNELRIFMDAFDD